MRVFAKDVLAGAVVGIVALLLLYAVGFLLAYRHLKDRAEQTGIGWDPVRALTPAGLALYLAIAIVAGALVAHRLMK